MAKKKENGEKTVPKKRCSGKHRTFTFVLYPEDKDTKELLDYLKTDTVEGIRGLYIQHKGELKKTPDGQPLLDDEGTPQYAKDHIHVMIEFPNGRSAEGVRKALCFEKIEISNGESEEDEQHHARVVFPVSDRTSMYYYFLHWTFACAKAGKERYEEKDIHLLGNDSQDFWLSCNGEKKSTSRKLCAELLSDAMEVHDCRELLIHSIDDEEKVKFLVKNPYFVKSFIMRLGGNEK